MDEGILHKLRLKGTEKICLVGVPSELEEAFRPLPPLGRTERSEDASVVVIFVRDMQEMEAIVPLMVNMAPLPARLWIAYAKRSSGQAADVDRDIIMRWGPMHNLKAVANISINEVWSAVRVVRQG
jgi:hypothetical protein